MKTKYSHVLVLAFEMTSCHPDGEDLTPAEIANAISNRVKDLLANKDEMLEATLPPTDTYKIEE